jgi:hypothetical protein
LLYGTNCNAWICACPSFSDSPYWICKHLVHLSGVEKWTYPYFHRMDSPIRFNEAPFIRLHPTQHSLAKAMPTGPPISLPNSTSRVSSLCTMDILEKVRSEKRALDILEDHILTKNAKQVERVRDVVMSCDNRKAIEYCQEVEAYEARRVRPRTWKDSSTYTMYLD